MKHTLIIITFIVALGCANAQERLFYDTPCDGVTTDIQGNLFLFHDDNLERIAADGTKQLSYGEPTFGNIAQVDANIASTPNKPQRKKRFPRPVFATNGFPPGTSSGKGAYLCRDNY